MTVIHRTYEAAHGHKKGFPLHERNRENRRKLRDMEDNNSTSLNRGMYRRERHNGAKLQAVSNPERTMVTGFGVMRLFDDAIKDGIKKQIKHNLKCGRETSTYDDPERCDRRIRGYRLCDTKKDWLKGTPLLTGFRKKGEPLRSLNRIKYHDDDDDYYDHRSWTPSPQGSRHIDDANKRYKKFVNTPTEKASDGDKEIPRTEWAGHKHWQYVQDMRDKTRAMGFYNKDDEDDDDYDEDDDDVNESYIKREESMTVARRILERYFGSGMDDKMSENRLTGQDRVNRNISRYSDAGWSPDGAAVVAANVRDSRERNYHGKKKLGRQISQAYNQLGLEYPEDRLYGRDREEESPYTNTEQRIANLDAKRAWQAKARRARVAPNAMDESAGDQIRSYDEENRIMRSDGTRDKRAERKANGIDRKWAQIGYQWDPYCFPLKQGGAVRRLPKSELRARSRWGVTGISSKLAQAAKGREEQVAQEFVNAHDPTDPYRSGIRAVFDKYVKDEDARSDYKQARHDARLAPRERMAARLAPHGIAYSDASHELKHYHATPQGRRDNDIIDQRHNNFVNMLDRARNSNSKHKERIYSSLNDWRRQQALADDYADRARYKEPGSILEKYSGYNEDARSDYYDNSRKVRAKVNKVKFRCNGPDGVRDERELNHYCKSAHGRRQQDLRDYRDKIEDSMRKRASTNGMMKNWKSDGLWDKLDNWRLGERKPLLREA